MNLDKIITDRLGYAPCTSVRVLTREEAGEDRVLEFVASTEEVASDGLILLADGWDLVARWEKNAPFLWAHNRFEMLPPLGQAIRTWFDKATRALHTWIRFATEEDFPFADRIYRLYRAGIIKAVSVGFRIVEMRDPLPAEKALGAWGVSLRHELHELSAVPVGADSGALKAKAREALQAGLLTRADADGIAHLGSVRQPMGNNRPLQLPAGSFDVWDEVAALVRTWEVPATTTQPIQTPAATAPKTTETRTEPTVPPAAPEASPAPPTPEPGGYLVPGITPEEGHALVEWMRGKGPPPATVVRANTGANAQALRDLAATLRGCADLLDATAADLEEPEMPEEEPDAPPAPVVVEQAAPPPKARPTFDARALIEAALAANPERARPKERSGVSAEKYASAFEGLEAAVRIAKGPRT